jgi:hypothetical protein
VIVITLLIRYMGCYSWRPVPTTSTSAVTYEAPPAPDTPGTDTTTCHGKPEVTMARSLVLAFDDAINGRHEGIVGHTTNRQATGTNEVRLLSPRHHFLKSKQKQEKWEWHKPTTNTIHILGGHQQERPRVGLLA